MRTYTQRHSDYYSRLSDQEKMYTIIRCGCQWITCSSVNRRVCLLLQHTSKQAIYLSPPTMIFRLSFSLPLPPALPLSLPLSFVPLFGLTGLIKLISISQSNAIQNSLPYFIATASTCLFVSVVLSVSLSGFFLSPLFWRGAFQLIQILIAIPQQLVSMDDYSPMWNSQPSSKQPARMATATPL